MTARRAPELTGLVLAGGESRRMERDKGSLDYHGLPQAAHCQRLLAGICARAFVSVNRRQSARDPYRGLPLIEDTGGVGGPAAGLLSAWAVFPDTALLALAVDLPLVDAALLERLVEKRNSDRAATAWVHPDGILEPLCAIWEPGMRSVLTEAAAAGSPSLRRLLEAADVERLEPPEPGRIASVNTEEDYRAALCALARR